MPNTLKYEEPVSGPPVSTEEHTIGGTAQHLQRMKLGMGAEGSYQGDLSLGQALSASSVPVVLPSDQYVRIEHSRSPLAQVTGTANALNGTPIAATDVSYYRSVSVQLSTAGNTCVFEGSNDGVTWFSLALLKTSDSWQVVSTSTNGIFYGPICVKHFRVRISAYTSGTVSATAQFSALNTNLHGQHVRTEVGFPLDSTEVLPSGQNAGQVESLSYGYDTKNNVWRRAKVDRNGVANTNVNKKPTYYGSSNGVISMNPTANASTSLAYLWHDSSVSKKFCLQKIMVSFYGGSAGEFQLRLARITAQPGDPGDTLKSVHPQSAQDASSNAEFRVGVVDPPTRQSGDFITIGYDATDKKDFTLYDVLDNRGFTCHSGVDEGWELRAVAGSSNIGQSPRFTATFSWIEEDE